MKVKDYVLEESLGHLVTKANRELNLTLFRNFKNVKIEITPEQWGVMIHLWKKDGITQQELGISTGRDNPGMTRIIDTMEKSGFVNRKPVKNDRRINLIYLTEMGKQLQEELITQAIKTLLAAGKGIKKSDMEICKSVLRKVYNNLKD
jgi:DNA-binding MarR family transcriptional regulator